MDFDSERPPRHPGAEGRCSEDDHPGRPVAGDHAACRDEGHEGDHDRTGRDGQPGLQGRPAQMPCSQSTIESSIPPNEAEKKMATIDAPLNVRERNSDGWMSGLRPWTQ